MNRTTNPYPGLRPFDREFIPYFFGRDRQISELIDRVRGNRFVAVVGLSGSGKSSLVRAGLLPALRAGQLGYAGSGWRIATLRPSEQPVATLAAELNKDDVLGPAADRAEILEGSTVGLLEVTKATTKEERSPQTNLLVFVDQFEDVFRFVNDGKLDVQRAAHFINLLLAVPAEPQPDFPVYVVITLRSEYLGSCARFYGLPEALNRSQYLVPRLTPEQFHDAIEAPAALMDVAFEPALVQRLLADASTAPDELPRLQHLLMRLWEFRTGETITLDEYRLPKIGGLEKALDLHAEEVYATLTNEQRRIAQRAFQRLTAWDESGRDARRPTALHELAAVSGATPESAAEVVRPFREAHFLTEIPAVGEDEPLLDTTHESLIRHWKRLEEWAKKEARYKKILLSLASKKRPLWSNVEVREAIRWRDELQPNEAWAERYAPGRLGAALNLLERLETDLTSAAKRRHRHLEKLRQESLSRQLTAESVSLLAGSPDSFIRSALLAVESIKRRQSLENHAALRQSIALMPHQLSRVDHQGPVTAVAFRPNGMWIATGSEDGTARVTDAATGKEVSRLAHQGPVSALAFSPDGNWVATASYDETTRVMAAATGRELSRLAHQGTVCALSFSPDGNWVATGGHDNTARVMEVATGKEVSRLPHQGPVSTVAFSPDGNWVTTGSYDETARVMEAATGKEVSRLTHQGRVCAVTFSPDGKWVATGSHDNTARVMEAATGREVSRLAHEGLVRAVAFSPDSKWVATGNHDNTARVMEAAGNEVSRLVLQNWVCAVAFSPNGKWVATGSYDKTARVMEASTGKEVARIGHHDTVYAVAFSPDGKWVATGSYDMTARVTEAATSKEVSRLAHQNWVYAAAFSSPDGRWVATGSYDKTARVFETADGKELSHLAHPGTVFAVAFSPDGGRVATGSEDENARAMEVATGKEVWRLGHQGPVNAVAFSPDGKWVATGSGDMTARVIEAPTGKQMSRLAHQGPVTAVAFSSDSRWVATASSDKTARVVEVVTGQELARFAHPEAVTAVAFSPDTKLIITGSDDNIALVIEAATGKETSQLAHQGPIYAVAFSPDGKRFATGSDDKTVRVTRVATGKELVRHQLNGKVMAVCFKGNSTLVVATETSRTEIEILHISLDPTELIRDACSRLPRNLAREEWDRYLPGEPYRLTCPKLLSEPRAQSHGARLPQLLLRRRRRD